MIRTATFPLAVVLVLAAAAAESAETPKPPAPRAVTVSESTLTLPTYEELPTSTRASLSRRPFLIYPYTARTNLTDRRSPRTWRTLELENEQLKLVVLPDLGGRIYSCVDKATGQDLFYANTAIKFADVAYRGAWVALGVELNFPVSHNWMTVSPVDFATVRHEDGSASVWVGNIDRPYGMQWRVELRLRPGRSLLEQTTTLYNRSDGTSARWTTASVRPRHSGSSIRWSSPRPPLRRRGHPAGGRHGDRPQPAGEPRRGLRLALLLRQPRALHGGLPATESGASCTSLITRTCPEEDLVLGMGRRGP